MHRNASLSPPTWFVQSGVKAFYGKIRCVMTSATSPTATTYSTIAGAISGVAIWALSTYAFHGVVPEPVQVALYVLIPAAVTGIASYLTKAGVITAQAKLAAATQKPESPPA